ncbi:MAG: hypothetical protein M3433_03620 [Actinomycetota bacterium]|nr:hypothetical protein [Actinomycetota bacterium]
MCRILGCVAAEPASVRHELLDAPNPLIRQSEHHDSGWGMAVYERAVFRHLVAHLDPADTIGSLRRTIAAAAEASVFSGLNFLFADGFRLYAYRFGLFGLFWVSRPGRVLVSSEKLTEDEEWHTVGQDVLLVLEPESRLNEPHAERLLGDELTSRARLDPLDEGAELTGEERGRFAAERALRIAGADGP